MNRITATLNGRLSFPLDPGNISTTTLYHVHQNLWGTLLGPRGTPRLAKLTESNPSQTEFSFELLKTAKTSEGRALTSQDIAFTFRRLESKNHSGHFKFSELIQSIDIISAEKFKIRLRKKTPSFLFILSLPETGIVPPESCDSSGKITNLKVTTGAYTVMGEPTDQHISLKLNPYFEFVTSRSPNEVAISFGYGYQAVTEIARKNNDAFFEWWNVQDKKLQEELTQPHLWASKETRPSNSYFLVVNPDTLRLEQRVELASLIQSEFDQEYPLIPEVEKRIYEFLPQDQFGSMGLKKPYHSTTRPFHALPQRIRFGIITPTAPLPSALQRILRKNGIQVEVVNPLKGESYDLLFWGHGLNWDFPEIEFYLALSSSFKYLPTTSTDHKLILSAFHAETDAIREDSLKKLSESLLKDGRIIPLVLTSYLHFYNPSKITSKSFGNFEVDIRFWEFEVLT